MPRADPLAAADALLARLPTDAAAPGADPAADLLFGRAGSLGLRRRGTTSAGGASRLLPAADGWLAVSLARPDDLDAVGAIVEAVVDGGPWTALAEWAAGTPAREVVDRCALLGVPAAALGEADPPDVGEARRLTDRRASGDLLVDLSAMWAGPLCAHLLGRSGLRVVKVEDPARPDGARSGPPELYDRLHDGHAAVVIDLADAGGRAQLASLLERAAVVIESSRPRALRQWGVEAEEVVRRTGCTWVSVTGHGRAGPSGDRVAFGDDAAVAGGLVADGPDGPLFTGDAVADPLTGLRAAALAVEARAAGGGWLLDVAMARTAAWVRAEHRLACRPAVTTDAEGWSVTCCGESERVVPPVPVPQQPVRQ